MTFVIKLAGGTELICHLYDNGLKWNASVLECL